MCRLIALSTFFLLVHLSAYSQNLINESLKDRSLIVIKEPFKFTLNQNPWRIKMYLDRINENNSFNDTLLLTNLIDRSKTQDSSVWSSDEITGRILINKGQQIRTKKTIMELDSISDEDRRSLKKQIRKYNNQTSGWRKYPISVSRPICSNDNNYCIIAIEEGNNGGEIGLYELNNDSWSFVGYLDKWAY